MFSVSTIQSQILAQLSQLSCGVLTSASSPGIRSNTTKTAAQKLKFNTRQTGQGLSQESTITLDSTPSVLNTFFQGSLVEGISTTVKGSSQKLQNEVSLELTSRILLSASFSMLSDLPQYSRHLFVNQTKLWEKILGSSDGNIDHWNSAVVKALFRDPKLYEMVLSSLKFGERNSHNIGMEKNRSISSSPFQRFSFCSLGSFEMDKSVGPLVRNLRSSGFNQVPYRTFKTKRGSEADDNRNPSIFSRMKNKLFPPLPSLGESTTNTVVGSSQSQPKPIQLQRLKTIISELPPDEAHRMKMAFAEGYVAANPNPPPTSTRTYRWLRTLQQLLAIAVFTAILASLMGSFGGGMFRVNVGNGNEVQPEDISVTFNDVKGVDEAKSELMEVVDFLKNPEKFVQLGGKLPKGVLLVGPPGTGKTLLARAVAGEAGVPFFHAAGPEFDEILVGQGARRVRDLFKAAKAKAPCVIFIDEIDSVGAKRTNSVLHPYANQTINQLLSEMDGFRQNEGVIVLGATNRREDLDKALLRPGRFDVEVAVAAPEYKGRKDILDYYLGRIKKSDDVDVETLARGTTGFTGADLENMVNQAALRAAIEGAERVFKKHLDFARDKVIMGPERKTKIPDEETNKITAYHEGGHAIVAHFTKDAHPLHKVTIIPRGQSLGHTAYIPEKERYHVTRSQLMAMMDTMMGGRAAEELIFGMDKITSGASSDLKQATAIASHMVKEWGMSEKVGLRAVEDNNKSLVAVSELGPQTSELIDLEIKRILAESYDRAKAILRQHSKEHIALAEALLKYETLDAEDVKALFAGEPRKDPIILTPAPLPSIPPSGSTGSPNITFGLGKRPSPLP